MVEQKVELKAVNSVPVEVLQPSNNQSTQT